MLVLGHPKIRATAATNNLLSSKQHPGRIFSLILKEMDCLNVPLGVGNVLGFISVRQESARCVEYQNLTLHFPSHCWIWQCAHSLGRREMAPKSPGDCKCRGKLGGTGVTGMESWDSAGPRFPPLQWEPALPSKGSWCMKQGLGEMWCCT